MAYRPHKRQSTQAGEDDRHGRRRRDLGRGVLRRAAHGLPGHEAWRSVGHTKPGSGSATGFGGSEKPMSGGAKIVSGGVLIAGSNTG
jgi:hypothetical protein